MHIVQLINTKLCCVNQNSQCINITILFETEILHKMAMLQVFIQFTTHVLSIGSFYNINHRSTIIINNVLGIIAIKGSIKA